VHIHHPRSREALKYFFVSVFAVVLTAISALVYGYEYGINPNQIQILPFIERIKDASLFRGDYFVDTIRRFPSLYPYIIAFLSKCMPMQALPLCGLGLSETKFVHKTVYSILGEKDFKLIRDKYGAQYVIEDARRKLSFEPVYKNGSFCVYKIR
jgi:hypothetical protein